MYGKALCTQYNLVKCISLMKTNLNRERNELFTVLHVKRNNGYVGKITSCESSFCWIHPFDGQFTNYNNPSLKSGTRSKPVLIYN